MAKGRTRHTCTECSRRRQQCDRRIPCARCIKRGVPERCQLEWPGGYDPARHRVYPSNEISRPASTQSPPSTIEHSPVHATRPLDYAFKPFRDVQLRMSSPAHITCPVDDYLQTLLPSTNHIWKLIDYHEQYLLWYHCCYHGPTFRHELDKLMDSEHDQTLNVRGLHLQWLALLFSVMAGSLTCTSEQRLHTWGFSKAEVSVLSEEWYKASIFCLNHSHWTSDHTIYSIQAITTLTMSAHALGRSAELSILLGAAIKVACALGLDQLDYDAAVEEIDSQSSDEQRHRMLRRDMGRKLWSQLCVQDWLSVPFFGSHIIHPRHFTSTRPSSRSHLTMEHIPETFPTYISYGNYIFDIAKLVAQHHEATIQATTPFTRYSHVVDYGARMRELATKDIPKYFHVTQPVDVLWPEWIHWARSSLTVCFAHKIIMIHRDYIRQSFTNPAYATTKVTCIAAAKTILNEAQQNESMDGPIIWIDKAFCVTAALILCLDISQRSRVGSDLAMHRQLVNGCIAQLETFPSSVVAARGVKLIRAVLLCSDSSQAGSEESVVSEIMQLLSEPDDAPGDSSRWNRELCPPLAGFNNHFLLKHLMILH